MLRRRAGDTVTFSYLPPGGATDAVLLSPAVLAVAGELGAGGLQAVLEEVGVVPKVALAIAQLLTSVPRFFRFRVDELHVASSEGGDPEITIKLVNFVLIDRDAQDLALGEAVHVLAEAAAKFDELVSSTESAIADYMTAAYGKVVVGAAEEAAVRTGLDALQKAIFKAKS